MGRKKDRPRKRVMIVDDDDIFLEELKETLEHSGYQTTAISDGEAAVKTAKEETPDLILLDLRMEKKSGFQVASELKGSHIPIVAMTGYYTRGEHSILMDACRIQACIMKPFNPLDVISKIEWVCR